jgi:hypothetical protein
VPAPERRAAAPVSVTDAVVGGRDRTLASLSDGFLRQSAEVFVQNARGHRGYVHMRSTHAFSNCAQDRGRTPGPYSHAGVAEIERLI